MLFLIDLSSLIVPIVQVCSDLIDLFVSQIVWPDLLAEENACRRTTFKINTVADWIDHTGIYKFCECLPIFHALGKFNALG